jgi:hypothetical protein
MGDSLVELVEGFFELEKLKLAGKITSLFMNYETFCKSLFTGKYCELKTLNSH